ncbi:MAG: aspartate kinase [Rickettsiales bacterium]|nr:aspartate kinase [Rickettsiales bacterium]
MALIVMKFGGTSVGSTERICHVATLVLREVARGNRVIVNVSAMSGVTDSLITYVKEVSTPQTPEAFADMDFVVSTGEQVTAGLLALRLQEIGQPARAFAGWQIPVITSDAFTKARVENIETQAINAILDQGHVAVVAGFQGMTPQQRVTTLGRGGSDTSAVALAAAFAADRCDIYTDVDGVYTADPRIVRTARKLDRVSYEEMLELASQGSKVLQTRSVELAMNYGVQLQVLSTFEDKPGTLLVREEEIVEKHRVTGIAYSRDDARITIAEVEDRPGVAAAIFGPLAEANINVDMIVQNVTPDGKATDMTFTVARGDLARAIKVLKENLVDVGYGALHTDENVAKVSVIGVGMRSHAGVAQEMFATLAEKGINLIVISTSEIKISVLIQEAYLELALRSLHTTYGLDAVVEHG